MKRWSIVLITILFLAIAGCGGSSGGDVLTPGDGSEGEETPSTESIDESQAEDVLYAAYAGIGYNRARQGLGGNDGALYNVMFDDLNILAGGSAEEEDDEALYNVMFDDLNEMVGGLVLELISNQTVVQLTQALAKLIFGNDAELEYTTDQGVCIVLTLHPVNSPVNLNESFTIHAGLTVDFNDTGYEYEYGNAMYYGNAGKTDFEANMEIDVVATQVGSTQTSQITIPSFLINAHSSLGVSYAETAMHRAFYVQYQGWSVSYSIEENGVNIHIIPVSAILGALGLSPDDFGMDVESYPDHRLYTLDGSFEIDDDPYSFDIEYGQLNIKYDDFDEKYIALKGSLSVPGLDGDVDVSSPGSEIFGILRGNWSELPDLKALPDAIHRDDTGIWTSGKMTIAAGDDIIGVEFHNDGSASFDNGWDPVPGWQDGLDPLL